MNPQFIKTELGEELVVLTRRDYLVLLAQAGDEEAEDILTVEIAAKVRADLDAGREVLLPDWFAQAAMKGEGSVLRGLREHRGLSQDSVAATAGITQGDYSEIERGAAVPTVEVLDRISDALDLDRTWMRCLERDRVAGA
ncbi:helix-turn-helix domain-containing protein [Methylobacterium trifolii]|uniref:HTH cro/C1-type domain-containing protein n=1 Tax=Methylobacterium trifolii TaxID=1003092 RepID=A0ABQ4U6K9_9HYPH|nr:helix-turn-helix transcriptional regulator [Methylobacterium trifolii]GJE61475.1 hypothetical protein MPOCJGCO_3597 [Methylobacterium trifolii]